MPGTRRGHRGAPEEYAALVEAKEFIVEVTSFEEKFDLVVSNHLELEKTSTISPPST